jgi:hypothetical protein
MANQTDQTHGCTPAEPGDRETQRRASPEQGRTVDAAMLRRLAVLSESDPRSVRNEISGKRVRGLSGHRIRRVLHAEGLLPSAE